MLHRKYKKHERLREELVYRVIRPFLLRTDMRFILEFRSILILFEKRRMTDVKCIISFRFFHLLNVYRSSSAHLSKEMNRATCEIVNQNKGETNSVNLLSGSTKER